MKKRDLVKKATLDRLDRWRFESELEKLEKRLDGHERRFDRLELWRFESEIRKRLGEKAPKTIEQLYHELLYAVGSKYPNETRHQTALRYIREAEEKDTKSEAKTEQLR
jgi:two-component SAPR family response regulator